MQVQMLNFVKKNKIYAVAIIAFLTGFILGNFLQRDDNDIISEIPEIEDLESIETTEESANDNDSTQSNGESKEYTNSAFSYKINYPSNWTALDAAALAATSDSEYVEVRKETDSSAPSFSVNNQIKNETDCNFIYDHTKEGSGGIKSFDVGKETINGREYIVSEAIFDDPSMNFQEIVMKYRYWAGSSGICHILSRHDNLEETNKETLEQILSSFELT